MNKILVIDFVEGFKSKTGKRFSARLKLEDHPPGPPQVVFDFTPAAAESPGEKAVTNSEEPGFSEAPGESQ